MLTPNRSPVSSHPGVMGGAVFFRGMRVPVQTLVDYLADGYSLDECLTFLTSVKRVDAKAFMRSFRDAA
jgi:uncharacterized protein (DUF433 family)